MKLHHSQTIFEGASQFCANSASIWKLVGNVINIIKIVIPIIIVIFFIVTIVQAVFGLAGQNLNDDDSKICWICATRPGECDETNALPIEQ